MSFWTIFLIAVGLAMDCFAVSLGAGTAGVVNGKRPVFRLFFHFGLFQGGMTVLGWLGGTTIEPYIASLDHWIALALLAFVGLRMVREGLQKAEEASFKTDPTRGSTLVMLSVATSIDALAVGLSLAMLKVNVFGAALVIGAVSSIFSLVGLLVGKQLGLRFGKVMEVIGGVILLGIGVRIVITHLAV